VRGFFLPKKNPAGSGLRDGVVSGGRLQQEHGIGAEHLVVLCHAGTQPRVCSATGLYRIINFTEVLPFHHSPTRHPVPLPLFSSGMKSPKKKPTAAKPRN
jgi:hypothetical protein